jgi:hypothetical protein
MTTGTRSAGPRVAWKFGANDLLSGIVGATLYTLLHWVFQLFPLSVPFTRDLVFIRPSLVLPLFMGLAYGPLVGGFVGAVGRLGGGMLASTELNWPWIIADGLIGFLAGLSVYVIRKFATLRDYGLAEAFVLLGCWGGSAFGALVGEVLILRRDTLGVGLAKLISEGLTGTLSGVLLMPMLLLVWNALRAGRQREH